MVFVATVHQRFLPHPSERVGALLEELAGCEDVPRPGWGSPAKRLDRSLRIFAAGGHGPFRWFVRDYRPGSRIVYQFTAPRGLRGTHGFEVLSWLNGSAILRHELGADLAGTKLLAWPLLWRPLLDALIEDVLDAAEACLVQAPIKRRSVPARVRLLRNLGRKLGQSQGCEILMFERNVPMLPGGELDVQRLISPRASASGARRSENGGIDAPE